MLFEFFFLFIIIFFFSVWSVNHVLAELERRDCKILVSDEKNEVSASFLKPLFVGSDVRLMFKEIRNEENENEVLEYHFAGFVLEKGQEQKDSKPYVVGKVVSIK
jgi:hypothetical protein